MPAFIALQGSIFKSYYSSKSWLFFCSDLNKVIDKWEIYVIIYDMVSILYLRIKTIIIIFQFIDRQLIFCYYSQSHETNDIQMLILKHLSSWDWSGSDINTHHQLRQSRVLKFPWIILYVEGNRWYITPSRSIPETDAE